MVQPTERGYWGVSSWLPSHRWLVLELELAVCQAALLRSFAVSTKSIGARMLLLVLLISVTQEPFLDATMGGLGPAAGTGATGGATTGGVARAETGTNTEAQGGNRTQPRCQTHGGRRVSTVPFSRSASHTLTNCTHLFHGNPAG